MDTITRLRNACLARLERVYVVQTASTLAIAKILKENKYIESFSSGLYLDKNSYICFNLNTNKLSKKFSSISFLQRVSRPGLRIYKKSKKLPKILGGLGISVFKFYFTFNISYLKKLRFI